MKAKIKIKQFFLDDELTIVFFRKIMEEDKFSKFIWNISENAFLWENNEALKKYLTKDFDEHFIYGLYNKGVLAGLIGAVGILNKEAKLIAWVDKKFRSNIFLIRWWILFILELKNKKIKKICAKILIRNYISVNSALRYGFIKVSEDNERILFVRDINLNDFEIKYKDKIETKATKENKRNKRNKRGQVTMTTLLF